MPDLLDYRERYPSAPGYQKTDTSLEAAESVAPIANVLRDKVLAAIRAAGAEGLTTNECADVVGIDKGSVQPRTSELRLMGEIKDSGMRRQNGSGRRAIVWLAA